MTVMHSYTRPHMYMAVLKLLPSQNWQTVSCCSEQLATRAPDCHHYCQADQLQPKVIFDNMNMTYILPSRS